MNRLTSVSFARRMLPILLIALLLKTGGAQASGTWKLIPSANPSATYNGLYAVAAVTPHDIWAVGAYNPSHHSQQPLIEHWNGTTWSVVPSPSANELYGVAALSAQQAWAVGDYSSGPAQETLIDQWNGTNWTMAFSPNPSSTVNSLNGVVAISASNVWAVGQYTSDISDFTDSLIEHWNGSTWAVVHSPSPGAGEAVLMSVAASSAHSIWAVGNFINFRGTYKTLIEHWDGSRWSVIRSPNPGSLNDSLSAVTAVSANNVWAVGQYESNTHFNTLIEHWDGTRWSVVSSPSPGSHDNALDGVAGVSANNIWAVGQDDQTLGRGTLIEHWNGSTWSTVSSPNGGSGDNILFAVARVPSTQQAWAVGQDASTTTQTIIEYHQ